MPHVYSTISTDMIYANYVENANTDIPVIRAQVCIKGGANVANKNIITVSGVRTTITDAELKELYMNEVFHQHLKNGFLKIEKMKTEIKKVVKNMTAEDVSSPITPENYSKRTSSKATIRAAV